MRIATSTPYDAPAGVILEEDLITRIPECRVSILRAAVSAREDRLLVLRAARTRYGWHPVHTVKIVILAVFGTFVFAYLISLIASFGHWYMQVKNFSLSVGLPIVGSQHLNIGSLVPTSTQLGVAAMIPQFGFAGSLVIAFVVGGLILIERLISAAMTMATVQRIKAAERRVANEIKTLKGWIKA